MAENHITTSCVEDQTVRLILSQSTISYQGINAFAVKYILEGIYLTAPIVFAFFWSAAFCELFLGARVTYADVIWWKWKWNGERDYIIFLCAGADEFFAVYVDCIKVLLYYKGNQCSLLTQGKYDVLIFSPVAINLGNLAEFTVEGRHAISWAYSLSSFSCGLRWVSNRRPQWLSDEEKETKTNTSTQGTLKWVYTKLLLFDDEEAIV